MEVRVAGASETIACESATIARGTSSAELMRRAGEAAAAEIAARFADEIRCGVAIFTGSGNNGGDGWVVAGSLARRGVRVRVTEAGSPRTPEARDARDVAISSGTVTMGDPPQGDSMIVDALLGTGASGVPRGVVADAIEDIEARRVSGAKVIALDLPSGLDSTTGAHERCVRADASISFGTVKRGHLIAREVCGEVVVVDIGLVGNETMSALPLLVDARWVHLRVPPIPVSANKGTRKRLSVVGGGRGMAGAAILSGEGALRSGIGLLRIVTAPESVIAVHAGLPAAIVQTWPTSASELDDVVRSCDAVAIGPGLGQSAATRDLVERVLLAWRGPVVLDADALNVFAGDVRSLAKLVAGRPAVITPHPAELGRLLGIPTADIVARRFEIGMELAATLGAAVLLKGTPTVVFSPSGRRYVSATGTAALATGGSGDVLTGMVGTLLAQMAADSDLPNAIAPADDRAAEAAACAAFVHGRAAEICGYVRGTTLDDILRAMPEAWNESPTPLRPGVLTVLERHS